MTASIIFSNRSLIRESAAYPALAQKSRRSILTRAQPAFYLVRSYAKQDSSSHLLSVPCVVILEGGWCYVKRPACLSVVSCFRQENVRFPVALRFLSATSVHHVTFITQSGDHDVSNFPFPSGVRKEIPYKDLPIIRRNCTRGFSMCIFFLISFSCSPRMRRL